MATDSKAVTKFLLLATTLLQTLSYVSGSSSLYLALLSYTTSDDLTKTCCDIVRGVDGLCEADAMCGLAFHASVTKDFVSTTTDTTETVTIPAPLVWRQATLAPKVFVFHNWTLGESTLHLQLTMNDQLTTKTPLVLDSARVFLVMDRPSDFYASFFIGTDSGAGVHVIARTACDTGYVGADCAKSCQTEPSHVTCPGEPGGGLQDWSRSVPGQALRYFGSPLARCPLFPPTPDTTTRPKGEITPTATVTPNSPRLTQTTSTRPTGLSPSSSSPSRQGTTTDDALKPSETTKADDISPTFDPSALTSVTTLSPSLGTDSTASSTATVQPSTSTLETSKASATASMEPTSERASALVTEPSSPTVAGPSLPTTSQHAGTGASAPRPPVTLPVVQFSSTAPSGEPDPSNPSVLIQGNPETTALAQTSDDPMRYWAAIVGGVVGGLVVLALLGYIIYRSRQRALQKRQEIYTVTPQSISSIEENGTSGRSDVPMTTALI